ncbi:glycosyltransferase family protein [Belliella buryatensis]|nr:glycosyltransferase family 4 protein [Belliella buryatensis]
MEKTRIVIASLLKPLKDSRAFYRMALSLRETNKYHLNIIGFSTKKEDDQKDIYFYSLYESDRTALKRLFVAYKFLRLLKKIKPKLIIVTTYELLIPAVIYKVLKNSKLIYDIQENHSLNIRFNRSVSKPLHFLISPLIQFLEFCSRPFIDQYILAETCYKAEIPKLVDAVILENKFTGAYREVKPKCFELDQPLRFLISGTLTEVYGIIGAMRWFGEFVQQYPTASLHVIGHVTIPNYGEEMIRVNTSIPHVDLEISRTPIAYDRILKAYDRADLVLLPYYQIPSISPKIPSKMYECLAMGKPFLHSPNEKWKSIANQHKAGLEVDFCDLSNIPQVIDSITSSTFFEKGIVKSAYWKAQEHEALQKLIEVNLKKRYVP